MYTVASRFYQIVQAVVTDFAVQVGREVTPFPSSGCQGWTLEGVAPPLHVYLDRRHLEQHGTYPRIVFVQTGGAIVPPDMVGGGLVSANKRDNIRRVRNLQVLTYAWGCDVEDAENMLHALIAAWDSAAHNAVVFGNETWEDQAESSDGWVREGTVVSFETVVQIPVYRIERPLTKVVGVTPNVQLVLPL